MTGRAPIEVSPDPPALARRAAEWLLAALEGAEGPCAVSLAGGTTPELMYRLLATAPFRARLPWERVHWFFGDERFVARDDPRSNFRMWRAALGDGPLPAANLHPMPTQGTPQGTPQSAADAYEAELQRFYGAATLDPSRPLFAATLLGLGADGHTASLFPGAEALRERRRWVVPVVAGGETRLTLTYPVLESSRAVAFLVSGSGKREMLARVRAGADVPAGRLQPVGSVTWLADRAALS